MRITWLSSLHSASVTAVAAAVESRFAMSFVSVYRSDDTHPPQLPWLSLRTIPYLIDKLFLGTWAPRRWYVLQVMHVVFRSFNAKHFIAFQFYVFYCSRFSRRATDYVQIRRAYLFGLFVLAFTFFVLHFALNWNRVWFGLRQRCAAYKQKIAKGQNKQNLVVEISSPRMPHPVQCGAVIKINFYSSKS